MRGYIDSIAFEIDDNILAKLELIGVVTVAKNGLILDEVLINEFVEYKATKSHSKQLLELRNLYKYLAILETQTGLKYKIMQHKRAKNITIIFRGLKQGNQISELMRYDLKEFLEHFKEDIQIFITTTDIKDINDELKAKSDIYVVNNGNFDKEE